MEPLGNVKMQYLPFKQWKIRPPREGEPGYREVGPFGQEYYDDDGRLWDWSPGAQYYVEVDQGEEVERTRKRDHKFVKVKMRLAIEGAAATNCKRLLVWLWLLERVFDRHTDTVTASNTLLQQIGVDRYTKNRALRDLEKAGLIRVDWRNRRNPIVTVSCK
jgi:hypothetical protein